MQFNHRTFERAIKKGGPYKAPTITIGVLTEVQLRLAQSGTEGIRSVVDQLVAAGKV